MNAAGILQVADALGLSAERGDIRITRKDVNIRCPLAPWRHKSKTDAHPSMGIKICDDSSSVVHCFGCHFKGSIPYLLDTLSYYSGVNYTELADRIERDEIFAYDWDRDYDSRRVSEKPPAGPAPEWEEAMSSWRRPSVPYLVSRGFDPITHITWEFGFDPYRRATTLPVRTPDRRLAGAVGRLVDDSATSWGKYYNYWNFSRRHWVLGLQHIIPSTTVIVVEGALDAPKLWQWLFYNNLLSDYGVLSTLGSEVNMTQASKIVSVADRVLLMMDCDDAGRAGTELLTNYLRDQVCLLGVDYPPECEGLDPDKLVDNHPGAIRRLLDDAKLIL